MRRAVSYIRESTERQAAADRYGPEVQRKDRLPGSAHSNTTLRGGGSRPGTRLSPIQRPNTSESRLVRTDRRPGRTLSTSACSHSGGYGRE
jgi:hypothetical protein